MHRLEAGTGGQTRQALRIGEDDQKTACHGSQVLARNTREGSGRTGPSASAGAFVQRAAGHGRMGRGRTGFPEARAGGLPGVRRKAEAWAWTLGFLDSRSKKWLLGLRPLGSRGHVSGEQQGFFPGEGVNEPRNLTSLLPSLQNRRARKCLDLRVRTCSDSTLGAKA